MSLDAFPDNAWGNPSPPALQTSDEPSVETALQKEKIIKDILTLRDGLRSLMVRVTEVEGETEKLTKDNDMLSVYIDNLTRNSVMAAGNKK